MVLTFLEIEVFFVPCCWVGVGEYRFDLSFLATEAPGDDSASAEVFNEVWSKVGEAFTIDPRLIEPGDIKGAEHYRQLGHGQR